MIRLLTLFYAVLLGSAAEMQLPPIAPDLNALRLSASDMKKAEVYARVACSLCHVFPEPSLLPKEIWNKDVLPKMKLYLGIDLLDVEKTPEGKLYKASGLFPDSPRIPKENWPLITSYYLIQAPTNLPAVNKPEISIGLKHFKVDKVLFRKPPPLTTALTIQGDEKVIFAGDANEQGIHVLTMDGAHLTTIGVGNIPTSIRKIKDTFYIGAIGHFFPVEEPRGQFFSLRISPTGGIERKGLFSNLPRVAHVEPGDFNADGKPDFAISMFGYLTGRFSWFQNLGQDQFKEHVLTNRSGAVQSAAYDFNRDGNTDLAVLFGQELEALWIYDGNGKGTFSSPKEVFRKPASYGHAAFDLADFNGDGLMDFIVANGDNGDYESPPKPYHGLRIYTAEKEGGYKEKYFYPMHGAFGVVARDFDEDGDIDIAAISFFPDYEKNPRDSFVYLENRGSLEFTASTFRECIGGRWITLSAGDLDGDGDIDLALGSLIRMPTIVPEFLKNIWENSSPNVLVLKNQLRSPSAVPLDFQSSKDSSDSAQSQ